MSQTTTIVIVMTSVFMFKYVWLKDGRQLSMITYYDPAIQSMVFLFFNENLLRDWNASRSIQKKLIRLYLILLIVLSPLQFLVRTSRTDARYKLTDRLRSMYLQSNEWQFDQAHDSRFLSIVRSCQQLRDRASFVDSTKTIHSLVSSCRQISIVSTDLPGHRWALHRQEDKHKEDRWRLCGSKSSELTIDKPKLKPKVLIIDHFSL